MTGEKIKVAEPEVSVEEVADIETAKPEVQVEEILVEAEAALPVEEEPAELEEIEEEEEEEEEEVIPAYQETEVSAEVETFPTAEAAVDEADEVEEVGEEVSVHTDAAASAADQLASVVSEKIKGKYLEDINDIIPVKHRKKFVKKMFKKDEHRFSKFINYLNQLTSWKKASAAIDEMLYQTGINPYSSLAVEFSDMVYNRYFPKDKRINRQDFM